MSAILNLRRKYELATPIVVQPSEGTEPTTATVDWRAPSGARTLRAAFTEYGTSVNSGPYTGFTSEKAIEIMTADAEARGFGKGEIIFRLKDWGISRQRYWGTPIPVLYCEKCGMVAVPDKDLPVVLPPMAKFSGVGQSPLASVPEFVNVKCPKCGGRRGARRTRWTPSSILRGTSTGTRTRTMTRLRLIRRWCGIGCPWINISAGSCTRFCIFCTRDFSAR